MAVKESSDELNPAVVIPQSAVTTAKARWRASDYVALAIATFGVGYLPLVPGTFGSLVGVAIFLLLFTAAHASFAVILVVILVITFAGIWAAFRTEELEGKKDPGKVVVDEVAGQMIALLPLTLFTLERLRGGYGIMCDDLVAGFYAAVIVSIWLGYGQLLLILMGENNGA